MPRPPEKPVTMSQEETVDVLVPGLPELPGMRLLGRDGTASLSQKKTRLYRLLRKHRNFPSAAASPRLTTRPRSASTVKTPSAMVLCCQSSWNMNSSSSRHGKRRGTQSGAQNRAVQRDSCGSIPSRPSASAEYTTTTPRLRSLHKHFDSIPMRADPDNHRASCCDVGTFHTGHLFFGLFFPCICFLFHRGVTFFFGLFSVFFGIFFLFRLA